MLEYLRGTITRKTPASVVVDVQGVGYIAAISLYTYERIREGGEVTLLVHEVLREDAHDLFAFCDDRERSLFRLLITVNGVGPNTARVMLSSYAPADLAEHIASGNEEALRAAKGIGQKTAQRIIVELRKRVVDELDATLGGDRADTLPKGGDKELFEEAVRAFVALGYPQTAARRVVSQILKQAPGATINEVVKQGLRMF